MQETRLFICIVVRTSNPKEDAIVSKEERQNVQEAWKKRSPQKR
jgi:hypothetical protein